MEQLISILTQINESIDYTKEKNLINDGLFSSFEILQCIIEIEEEFNIVLPPQEIMPENFSSAENIWGMIQRCQ